MENIRDYNISLFGEFEDKRLEREFFDYDMARSSKFIGYVFLIFGIVYMSFLASDYNSVENFKSFIIILIARIIVFAVSVSFYLSLKKINNYTKLSILITVYEFIAVIAFLVIVLQYKTLTFLSFFSVISMILAIYITPNKLKISQIISAFLCLSFFIFPAKHMKGVEPFELLKVFVYHLIFIIYCNIGVYVTNYYKRKQFSDSRELLRVSITDTLTGIYNRAKFDKDLNYWIEYSRNHEKSFSLVMFDIDNFKRVNDSHGHIIGDQVIQNIVSAIKNVIRSTDIFARWGGEEFAILFPNTNLHQAFEITERLRLCIQNINFLDEIITCSFGLAALRSDDNAEALLIRADRLLYNAKECGKNIVVCEINVQMKKVLTMI